MTKQRSYKQIKAELDEIMSWFESDEIDIDTATAQYKKAQQLVDELQSYLANAKNEISKL